MSVGRISIEILMLGLWIVDIEDDWKGLRMHNFWSWQPACQLLYWIMDSLSFSARRVKKPPDKGEVSRPNEIRENPCSAEWRIQNRTNVHIKFLFWISFQVLQARDIQEATKYYLWFGNCPPQTNYCSVHALPPHYFTHDWRKNFSKESLTTINEVGEKKLPGTQFIVAGFS